MKIGRFVLGAMLVTLAVASAALGDTLFLKNGKKFEGELVKETATEYHFKIRGIGTQIFPKAEVAKIEEGKSVFDEYGERAKKLGKGDAEGHYQLGVWCREKNLRKEAKKEFEAAMAADPDHAGARDELGFAKFEGKWITKEERDQVLADMAAKEASTFAALALDDPLKNLKARFEFRPPKDWKKEEKETAKTWFLFAGPVLGKAPVSMEFRLETTDDSLDDVVKALAKAVADARGDAKQREPKDAKLAGADAKHLTFAYVRDDLEAEDLPMERHDLVAKTEVGAIRFTLECRDGYYERLRPFFEQVVGSLKILEKGPDIVSEEHGFSLAFPDESYVKRDGFPIQDQNKRPLMPAEGAVVVRQNSNVIFLVVPGKVGDGKADTTSVQTLRDSMIRVGPIQGFVQPAGGEREVKVAGTDSLCGAMSIAGGRLGGGRWCAVIKGERYFWLFFLNLGNGMGQKYVDEDFDKFMAGFQVL